MIEYMYSVYEDRKYLAIYLFSAYLLFYMKQTGILEVKF